MRYRSPRAPVATHAVECERKGRTSRRPVALALLAFLALSASSARSEAQETRVAVVASTPMGTEVADQVRSALRATGRLVADDGQVNAALHFIGSAEGMTEQTAEQLRQQLGLGAVWIVDVSQRDDGTMLRLRRVAVDGVQSGFAEVGSNVTESVWGTVTRVLERTARSAPSTPPATSASVPVVETATPDATPAATATDTIGMRVSLRWQGGNDLTLIILRPDGVLVNQQTARRVHAVHRELPDASNGTRGEVLEWPSQPTAGNYAVCVTSARAEPAEFTIDVQVGQAMRSFAGSRSRAVGLPCSPRAAAFVTNVRLGNASPVAAGTSGGPSFGARDGRSTVLVEHPRGAEGTPVRLELGGRERRCELPCSESFDLMSNETLTVAVGRAEHDFRLSPDETLRLRATPGGDLGVGVGFVALAAAFAAVTFAGVVMWQGIQGQHDICTISNTDPYCDRTVISPQSGEYYGGLIMNFAGLIGFVVSATIGIMQLANGGSIREVRQ